MMKCLEQKPWLYQVGEAAKGVSLGAVETVGAAVYEVRGGRVTSRDPDARPAPSDSKRGQ